MNDKPAKPAIEMLTLKQLCAEIKSRPARGARETSFGYTRLKEKSDLAKSHKPGHTWEWPKNSLALKEARAALTSGC